MTIIINGEEFHRTAEACRIAGTSKNTFLRWVREGMITDVALRDRRGWRLFSRTDLARLKSEVNWISKRPGARQPKVTSVPPRNQPGNQAGEKG